MEQIIERIKQFEGFSLEPYQCPAKKWTIGYGYNYQDRGFSTDALTDILKNGFSETLAEKLVSDDAEACIKTAEKNFTFYARLNDARQAVIVDMVYQLGLAGIKKFKKMLAAIEKGDYETAAAQMVKSAWYVQSGRRSKINTEQMKTGVWQVIK